MFEVIYFGIDGSLCYILVISLKYIYVLFIVFDSFTFYNLNMIDFLQNI